MFQSVNSERRPATGLRRNNKSDELVPSKQVDIRPPFLNPPIQKAAEEDENLQKKADNEEILQGKFKKASSPGEVNPNGTDTAMPEQVQSKMEESFGTDFSDVNIHKNDESATRMGALAYTQGNNVHFAPGQYDPSSRGGQELIGHELTHVVQQRQGRVAPTKQGKGMPVNDSPVLEKEADDMGALAAAGKDATAVKGTSEGVQKQDDAKGEIGLHNASVTEADGGVTVDGTTGDGKDIRDVHYDSEAEYNRSEGLVNELEEHAATHAFFEFVAHFLSYREPGYNPKNHKDVQKMISSNGYRFVEIIRGHLGFQYVKLESLRADQNDIIAFRGTNPGLRPSDLATIYADTDPTAVGYQQYRDNKDLIQNVLNNCKGKVDIAGHSLGGAVTQIVAAYHTAQIGNVYTFQSPGIDDKMVARFNNHSEEDKPNVYHHVAVGDMVDKAGEQNLPGNVFVHDFGYNWVHTRDLLQQSGGHIKRFAGNVGSILAESLRLTGNVSSGISQAWIPYFGSSLLADKIEDTNSNINNISEYINDAKQEAAGLKDLIGGVIEGVGNAHLEYLFSSNNFEEQRDQANIDDSFYTNGPDEGAEKETTNESSVVTAHESYPFQDERAVAEPVRDLVGGAVNLIINPHMLFVMYKTIDAVVAALKAVKKAMTELASLLKQMAVDAWEAISGIPDIIREKLSEIGRWTAYMNTLEFWNQFFNLPF